MGLHNSEQWREAAVGERDRDDTGVTKATTLVEFALWLLHGRASAEGEQEQEDEVCAGGFEGHASEWYHSLSSAARGIDGAHCQCTAHCCCAACQVGPRTGWT